MRFFTKNLDRFLSRAKQLPSHGYASAKCRMLTILFDCMFSSQYIPETDSHLIHASPKIEKVGHFSFWELFCLILLPTEQKLISASLSHHVAPSIVKFCISCWTLSLYIFIFLLPREHVLFCSGLSHGLTGLRDLNQGRRDGSTKHCSGVVVEWSANLRLYSRPPVTGSYLGPGLPTVWSEGRQITL